MFQISEDFQSKSVFNEG